MCRPRDVLSPSSLPVFIFLVLTPSVSLALSAWKSSLPIASSSRNQSPFQASHNGMTLDHNPSHEPFNGMSGLYFPSLKVSSRMLTDLTASEMPTNTEASDLTKPTDLVSTEEEAPGMVTTDLSVPQKSADEELTPREDPVNIVPQEQFPFQHPGMPPFHPPFQGPTDVMPPPDTQFRVPPYPVPPSSGFPGQSSQGKNNCDPLKKIFNWKNIVTAAVDEISERMIRYEEFELLDHYCSFFTRPYLIKWRIQILADVWCPGWTTIIGSGFSSKTSESIRLAIQDFVRRAQTEGVVHPDDVQHWYNNNNNNNK